MYQNLKGMKKTITILAMSLSGIFAYDASAQIIFRALEPANVAGSYSYTNPTDWSLTLTPPANAVENFAVLVDDGTALDSLGCNTLVNGAAVAGKIAFIYRGECNFSTKAKKAQDAGAVGIVIINNIPGEPVGMAGGTEGALITIPVMMIGQSTGALLRPSLDAGTLKVFMGSKLGKFPSDLGFMADDIIRPENFAMPSLLVQNVADYPVNLGGWVKNFGSNAQANSTLKATIKKGATIVYEQSASVASIASGDSAFIDLPTFTLPNSSVSEYVLTYLASSNNPDDDSSDNIITQSFHISDNVLSKSRFDFAANKPVTTAYNKLAEAPPALNNKIRWGILFETKEGGNVKAKSLKFSATLAAADSALSLQGEEITATLAEWNDDGDTEIQPNEVNDVAFGVYTYDANRKEETIEIPFEGPGGSTGYSLGDNMFYIVSITYENPGKSVFFGADNGLNYFETRNKYGFRINPLQDINASNPGAWNEFSMGTILSLSVQFEANNSSITENQSEFKLSAYPNPATEMVNITFGGSVSNSEVQVNVVDLAGRSIMNQQFNVTSENLVSVNTSNLANGSYFFKVSVNGQVVKSLPIVIAK
jgi:hypothetical protein